MMLMRSELISFAVMTDVRHLLFGRGLRGGLEPSAGQRLVAESSAQFPAEVSAQEDVDERVQANVGG